MSNTRYVPYGDHDGGRSSYRAPEAAGPEYVGPPYNDDDVIRQPGTMAALLLVVAIIAAAGLLIFNSYGPSTVISTDMSSLSSDRSD
jgi:hypothetical protein